VPNLLTGLSESQLLADRALVLLRHPLQVDYERKLAHLVPERTRSFKTMTFTWFRYDRML